MAQQCTGREASSKTICRTRRAASTMAMVLMVSPLALVGCAPPRWETATYDHFPLNWRRVENGNGLIKVVALVPGENVLSEAIGAELAKRGFVIIPSTATANMAAGVDFKAVSEHYIPARRNPGELWKLRRELRARDVDAFLLVRAHDFAPRQYRGNPFWQQADLEIHSTTEENATSNGAIAGNGWVNLRRDRAATVQEAAAEMVKTLATGPGAI